MDPGDGVDPGTGAAQFLGDGSGKFWMGVEVPTVGDHHLDPPVGGAAHRFEDTVRAPPPASSGRGETTSSRSRLSRKAAARVSRCSSRLRS